MKRFVAATIRSYEETKANPQAAINAMADIVGGTMAQDEKAQALSVLKVTLGVLYSPANKERRLGLNAPSDWEDMLNLMKTYNELKTDKPTTAFYVNSFLP